VCVCVSLSVCLSVSVYVCVCVCLCVCVKYAGESGLRVLNTTVHVRFSLFSDVTQHQFVVSYRHFGTICRSHFQGSSRP
jgi:hypothetical protein